MSQSVFNRVCVNCCIATTTIVGQSKLITSIVRAFFNHFYSLPLQKPFRIKIVRTRKNCSFILLQSDVCKNFEIPFKKRVASKFCENQNLLKTGFPNRDKNKLLNQKRCLYFSCQVYQFTIFIFPASDLNIDNLSSHVYVRLPK